MPITLMSAVEAINEAAFFARPIPAGERKALAEFIVSRHNTPGTYGRLFGLFPRELAGIRLFTGERVTHAAARHIAGEEACRALLLLKPSTHAVRGALDEATQDMVMRLGPAEATGPKPDDGQDHWLWPYRGGTYCCGACSAAVWRHLTVGGLDDQERRLARGLKCLNVCRKGEGTWRVFPFWYTVLALVEMDVREAIAELRYAAARLERAAKREAKPRDIYAVRRVEVARRALGCV